MRTAASLLLAVALVIAGCAQSDPPSPPAAAPAQSSTSPPPSAPRVLATDPAQLAADLVADENALRDPASPEDLLTAAAHRQQAAYRAIGRHPEWDEIVRPRIPQPLVDVYDHNVDARRHLEVLGSTRESVPAWEIREPAPADELLGYYRQSEAASAVGWNYLAAINLVETMLGRVVGASSAGAQGPMQFMPATFAAYGEGGDIMSPRDSIMAAGRYLAANGFAENRDSALFRYNNSNDYVRAVDDYANAIAADPAVFTGYHRWQIYIRTTRGDLVLPVGYSEPTELPVADYLARSAPDTPPAAPEARITPQSEAILTRLLAVRAAEGSADTAQRSELLSRQFLGIPYGADTLIGSESVPEQLVIELARADCFTYADYVEALKRSTTRDEFVTALIGVRYRDGVVAFTNRKHFFTDWSSVAPELTTDVTATLSPTAVQVGKSLNAKDSGGTYLPGLPVYRAQSPTSRAATSTPTSSTGCAQAITSVRTPRMVVST